MRSIKIVIAGLLLISFFIQAQQPTGTVTNTAYQPGENLKYVMYYGWIDAGEATVELNNEYYQGKKVHHATVVARTTGIANRLYNVYDVFESFFNPLDGLPFKAIRDATEGSYSDYNEVTFNHEENTIMSKKSGKREVPENISDILTAFYKMRRMDITKMKKYDIIEMNTYFEDDIFELVVRYLGVETIKTRIGTIECLKFSPLVEPGRAFDTEDDVKIWISNDKNLIPMRFQMDLFVGSFKADLIEYGGLKHKLEFSK